MDKKVSYSIEKIDRVKINDDGYELRWDNCTCCFLDKKYGIKPKVGQTIETYGAFGQTIRGICIDGKTAFFKGEVQL